MNPTDLPYDSRPDTLDHIARVNDYLRSCARELERRGLAHDQSKLEEPEKSIFDACTPRLKELVYGSDEYKAALEELKPALDHHYANNSHHPEHHVNGVDDMDLFDVIEMLMDWKAATERMKDGGDIRRSLQINNGRFRLSPQLASILGNTIRSMGW